MSDVKVVKHFDEMPPVTFAEGVAYSSRILDKQYREMVQVIDKLSRDKKQQAAEIEALRTAMQDSIMHCDQAAFRLTESEVDDDQELIEDRLGLDVVAEIMGIGERLRKALEATDE